MAASRRAFIKVFYDGKDITEVVSATVISLQYTDRASNAADEITLNCHDRENNWIGDWYQKLKSGGGS